MKLVWGKKERKLIAALTLGASVWGGGLFSIPITEAAEQVAPVSTLDVNSVSVEGCKKWKEKDVLALLPELSKKKLR